MNYIETMEYIKNTAKFGSNLGLERTEKILELLGNPHKKLRCIHIAGTNGKGSITAMISNILIESGYRVGMYTSPYLEEFEERIQINNCNISKEDLSKVVTKVAEAVDRVIALGYDHPTEFEIITCAMFLYFFEKKVDFAVVEVGLGGRLDSTNVIIPMVSVIASISYDHMKILGNTLPKIAFEKSGIVKNEVPLVLYPQEKCVSEVFEKVCKEKNSNIINVPSDCVHINYSDSIEINKETQSISIHTAKEIYDIELSLLGMHQLLNCAAAVFTVEELVRQGVQISKHNIIKGLFHVKWPGRLEVMNKRPLVVIDGAHNIDGIKNLRDSIETYFKYDNMFLVLGILADKEVDAMVEVIAPKAKKVFAVTPHNNRAEGAEELKKRIVKYNDNCEAFENYEEAYKKALQCCSERDLLLISGSLYMIGDMRKIIKRLTI